MKLKFKWNIFTDHENLYKFSSEIFFQFNFAAKDIKYNIFCLFNEPCAIEKIP